MNGADDLFYGDEIVPFEVHQILTYDSSDHGMLQIARETLQALSRSGKEASDLRPVVVFRSAPALLQAGKSQKRESFAYLSLTISPERTGKVFRCEIQGERRRIVYKGSSFTEALVRCIRSASSFALPEKMQEQIPERDEACHRLYKIWKAESIREK